MSDNDRKNSREIKQDHEHNDPLERLTRIFNPNKQRGHQNDQSSLQTDQSIAHTPKASSYEDDFDLSFLETEFENNLTNDLPNEPTSNAEPTTFFNKSEQNNFSSEELYSSTLNHDEEQILDELSPLPIPKNQSSQKKTPPISADPFFEKRDFNVQSENFFFNESDKHDHREITSEPIEKASRFAQTTSQQKNTSIKQNYDDNQSFHDVSINHPYKVSADQEKWATEYYNNVSSSTDTNIFPSSSDLISEKKDIAKNETEIGFPSSFNSTQMDKQSYLEGVSQERYSADYPQFYEEESVKQETYAGTTPKYRDAQNQYINSTENSSKRNNKEASYQNNLNDMHPSSEPLSTKQRESLFAHNYMHRDTPPPNVNTHKFAEEIVEKTGPIMVPEVPYEAPEYDVPTDDLKEEFADIFNVGNVSAENFLQQQQQSEVFNEIFHQTMDIPKEDAYTNLQDQNANYAPANNVGYNSSFSTENALYKGIDEIPMHASSHPPVKSSIVGKTLTKTIVLLILITMGFFSYSHFFMPSQKNGNVPIIHADNTPFKFKQETTETKNDVAHNLDIYKQTTEQNEKQENTQQSLIDNSEQPEDLTELNQQKSTSFSSSSPHESDVEDAVTEAINHTIPTREVQTVIVNQDGTVVLAPMDHTEKKTADEPQETTNHTTVDQSQDFSPVSSQDSNTNNKGTEHNFTSAIDKIIAESTSPSKIEGKVIPLPSYAKKNSERQLRADSRTASPNRIVTQNAESYYVQLASQPTHALAKDSLENIKSRFGFLIGTRPLNIQSALIPGKGTYYRVRIQTQNRNDAVSLCENIKSSGGNCFITR
ncbi:SPOR domain-containing protein [Bartonella sp. 220]|uniref:SPOR domain-containing protein n=1 Tax=Bartonella sp. 220B TaxID=2967260 RepID=UPI0022A95137|nr:SPOR domain-containing protein [Bartonella sp. 220B]MCZ2158613.1 SPOR domain-containing protein [Bartonella sp. 220B]